MDKKFSILDYLGQVFMLYGITMALLNVFCLLFGEDAFGYSSMFALGSQGVSVATSFQFLGAVAIIAALPFLFMTDLLIKNMPVAARTAALFAGVLITILAFIFFCGWVPNKPSAWIMFVICFVISCAVSTFVSAYKEKQENKKLEEALKKLKEEP